MGEKRQRWWGSFDDGDWELVGEWSDPYLALRELRRRHPDRRYLKAEVTNSDSSQRCTVLRGEQLEKEGPPK